MVVNDGWRAAKDADYKKQKNKEKKQKENYAWGKNTMCSIPLIE